jgi:predicted Zn-dependent protease
LPRRCGRGAKCYELLMRESRAAPADPRIVDWEASLAVTNATHRLITSEGGDIVQRYRFLFPHMTVTAHADGDTQTRTLFGDRGICQQGGEEILERFGFAGSMRRLADEALELVAAPNCPSGTMDVLLLPDQMILQIHESIGIRWSSTGSSATSATSPARASSRPTCSERTVTGLRFSMSRSIRRAARSSRATAGTTRAARPSGSI